MCEPATLMAASAVMTLGAAAYSGYQQNQAGKANQQIAENNATLARQDSAAAQASGDRESEQMLWRTRAALGQQRAAAAANGLDIGFGTPAEIMGETAMFGEAQQQTIRANAARQAWGFNSQATNYQNQGRQDRWAGRTGAVGTVLGGLGSAAGQWGTATAARRNARVGG